MRRGNLALVGAPSPGSMKFLFIILTSFWTFAADPIRGKHGMVVSSHALASEVGVDVLRKGGNAVDAAVATGIALAVVHPSAGNIGAEGSWWSSRNQAR